LFYSSLQALSLKNHDYSYLRKFWSFGIVLGMGAQLSVVLYPGGISKLLFLYMFFVKKKRKRKRENNNKKKRK